jgi:triosephosphate isomerase (TIM)
LPAGVRLALNEAGITGGIRSLACRSRRFCLRRSGRCGRAERMTASPQGRLAMEIDPRPLVVGNWKMHGLKSALSEISAICAAVNGGAAPSAEIVICPPATLIAAAAERCVGSPVAIGGQCSHEEAFGAHTGDISAEMLKDGGASFVIVGHSERRRDHGETDAKVRLKAQAAIRAGLTAIICIGETRAEREAGATLAVLARQIELGVPTESGFGHIVVAYEPVWAIGAGLASSFDDVAEAHAFIRGDLDTLLPEQGRRVRLLYGGSVTPSNASELMSVANVNGALVGGASLVGSDFIAIAAVYSLLTARPATGV